MCITNIVTVPFSTYTHKPSNKYKHNPVNPVYQESQIVCPLPPTPIEVNYIISATTIIPVYVFDQACSVKMAGGLKTERSQQSAILTQQAWSMKDLLYGQK